MEGEGKLQEIKNYTLEFELYDTYYTKTLHSYIPVLFWWQIHCSCETGVTPVHRYCCAITGSLENWWLWVVLSYKGPMGLDTWEDVLGLIFSVTWSKSHLEAARLCLVSDQVSVKVVNWVGFPLKTINRSWYAWNFAQIFFLFPKLGLCSSFVTKPKTNISGFRV